MWLFMLWNTQHTIKNKFVIYLNTLPNRKNRLCARTRACVRWCVSSALRLTAAHAETGKQFLTFALIELYLSIN